MPKVNTKYQFQARFIHSHIMFKIQGRFLVNLFLIFFLLLTMLEQSISRGDQPAF